MNKRSNHNLFDNFGQGFDDNGSISSLRTLTFSKIKLLLLLISSYTLQLKYHLLSYQVNNIGRIMLFLNQQQRQQIYGRIKSLHSILKNQKFIIFAFEALGTLVLAYGISVSQYKHPIKRQIPNPYMTFLVSCFLYLGIAIAAPFTGGHLNPSVTIGLTVARLSKVKQIGIYIISQICGAIIGIFIYYIILGSPPYIYTTKVEGSEIFYDTVSECIGTFIFLFGIIYTCKRNYMNGEYFKYLFIVLMLLLGRTFTFRKGCLNPAVGIALQLFAAIETDSHSAIVFFSIFGICIGSVMGAMLAAWFFNHFYEPLLDNLQVSKE